MVENGDKKYDLAKRTAKFAEEIIKFAKLIPVNVVFRPIISQLVRAGTSIGANYCEADDAFSKKEFCHRIAIYKKEYREAKYWLRLIVVLSPNLGDRADKLRQEVTELHLIFATILRKASINKISN